MRAVFYACLCAVENIPILGMTTVFQERIISTALLPHVAQAKVGSTFVDIITDRELWRPEAVCFNVVPAPHAELGKVKPVRLFEGTIRAKCFSRLAFQDTPSIGDIDELPR